MPGCGKQRDMDGEDIAASQQLLKGDVGRTIEFLLFRREPDHIVVNDLGMFKPPQHLCHFFGDVANPQETHRFSLNHLALGPHFGFDPLTVPHGGVHIGNFSIDCKHQAHGQLGHRDGIGAGRDINWDSPLLGCGAVNFVDPDPPFLDHLQSFGCVNVGPGNGYAAGNDIVSVADQIQMLFHIRP